MIFGLIGRRELGKTTLARYLAQKRAPRLTIDPRAQWRTDRAVDLENGAMMQGALVDLEDGYDVIIQPDNVQENVNDAAWVGKQYITRKSPDVDGQPAPLRQLCVTFDEAGLYSLRAWSWMFRCSPRDRVTLIMTAHRPQDIETDVRALMDYWCIFRTTQQHDLDAIEERCGAGVVAAVQQLKPYQFVTWNDAKGTAKLYSDPAAWYVPADIDLDDLPARDLSARGLF